MEFDIATIFITVSLFIHKLPFFCIERETLDLLSSLCYLPLQGLHPRIIAEGFEAASHKAAAALEELKVTREMDRETLISVARTSLRTKVHKELADLLTEVRKRLS